MNERYEIFLSEMGPAENVQHVPKETLAKFRGKLPDRLLQYWESYGWAQYGGGRFQTVNPEDYQYTIDSWLSGTEFGVKDNFYLIGYSAFGTLYIFGEKYATSLSIVAPDAVAIWDDDEPGDLNFEVDFLFSSLKKDDLDLMDEDGRPLFERASKMHGALKPGEIFGFFPALALGGPTKLENIKRVKAQPYLDFLAEISELSVMTVDLS